MEFLSPRVWLAMVVALFIGFGGGYYTKSKFTDAAVVEQVKKDDKQTATNVVVSAQTSQKVESEVQKSDTTVSEIQEAVSKRPKRVRPSVVIQPAQENLNEKSDPKAVQSVVSCDAYQLDVGTVRLLNAARKGVGLDSIASGDEALSAPSGITIDKLLQNDLEVVKLYHDLAIRHDQLVDEVEEKLKQQAK